MGCLSKIDSTHSFHGTWEHGKCQEFVATRRGVSCPLSAEVVSSPGSVPLATPLLGMDHVLGTPPTHTIRNHHDRVSCYVVPYTELFKLYVNKSNFDKQGPKYQILIILKG